MDKEIFNTKEKYNNFSLNHGVCQAVAGNQLTNFVTGGVGFLGFVFEVCGIMTAIKSVNIAGVMNSSLLWTVSTAVGSLGTLMMANFAVNSEIFGDSINEKIFKQGLCMTTRLN